MKEKSTEIKKIDPREIVPIYPLVVTSRNFKVEDQKIGTLHDLPLELTQKINEGILINSDRFLNPLRYYDLNDFASSSIDIVINQIIERIILESNMNFIYCLRYSRLSALCFLNDNFIQYNALWNIPDDIQRIFINGKTDSGKQMIVEPVNVYRSLYDLVFTVVKLCSDYSSKIAEEYRKTNSASQETLSQFESNFKASVNIASIMIANLINTQYVFVIDNSINDLTIRSSSKHLIEFCEEYYKNIGENLQKCYTYEEKIQCVTLGLKGMFRGFLVDFFNNVLVPSVTNILNHVVDINYEVFRNYRDINGIMHPSMTRKDSKFYNDDLDI